MSGSSKQISIQNSRPENYPTFPEAEWDGDACLIVDVGDFVVDRDGDLLEVTSANSRWINSPEFVKSINIGCFRAKYVGNRDDLMCFANQTRKATKAEIAKVQKWAAGDRVLVDSNQQVRLF